MNDSQPVFAQLVEIIENDILNGVYTENELIIRGRTFVQKTGDRDMCRRRRKG